MSGNSQESGRPAGVGAFGAALRRHRRHLELSQEDLADATRGGVAARTISDLERGVARRPRAETLRLLAAALCLTGEDLAEFKAAARAAGRPAAEVAAELAVLASAGLAEASRRVAARPLIIVADVARWPRWSRCCPRPPTACCSSPAGSCCPVWIVSRR